MTKTLSNTLILFIAILILCSCTSSKNEEDNKAARFIGDYTAKYLELYYKSTLADWDLNTKIIEGDTMQSWNARQAEEKLAEFTGSVENINTARELLDRKEGLDTIQIKILERILYLAADNPQTIPDLVKERIKAEKKQTEILYGFDFTIANQSVSTNDIDNILKDETNIAKRLEAWKSSKAVGLKLKDGLINLQNLRNETVRSLGYDDFFTYQVSEYGMSRQEMIDICEKLVRDIWPLYRELHTFTRYELAEKYDKPVPEMLPAHWLPNRWGQDWSAMIEVEGIDLDGILEEKGPVWLVEQGERFYVSMGFDELPESFYTESSLYPLPDSVDYKKNNHASAWHMDLQNDVRSLMSVIPNAEWYETTHHELGHIYYYMEYTNPHVPPILRRGANRAFHEAIGSMLGLAAMQKPFLQHLELLPADVETDETQTLLKEALNYIVFIPWSAGVMTEFENDLYAQNLSSDQFNQKWWELKAKYQGIVPPEERGEEYCDATSKTHINNDAAQYYDYALSYAIMFQFHNYIAENILNSDPRSTNYYGNKEVGKFLHEILSVGATKDWRQLMKETTGEEINAQAMLNYFEPLMDYLKDVNQGREHTLPETLN